ncbi:DUF6221 family protein [Streptomyces brasiliscabiei]|uniref:DUF6221 family protein n=1 Tax=Streptomyces brasiliscabiei TaxID=2736302 RepID=A0ABU8G9U3_9ACTN
MSDSLVVFLRARYDEDERIAQAACWDDQSDAWTARPPQASYERYTVVDYLDDGVVAVTPENADADGVGQHIARHDPARVLREIDAKRQTLAELEAAELAMDRASRDRDTARYNAVRAEWVVLRRVVRRDAAVYSDHPSYLEEWRP